MSINIDPPPQDKRSLREKLGMPPPSNLVQRATINDWQIAYERKLAEFAAETRKTSILIRALNDLGHRAGLGHEACRGCEALREVGAIDPGVPS